MAYTDFMGSYTVVLRVYYGVLYSIGHDGSIPSTYLSTTPI